MAALPRDPNYIPAVGGVSTTDGETVLPLEVDPVTGRLLVQADIDMATEGIATETTLAKTLGLSSIGTDTTLTLTLATTAYACPASSVPASAYTLVIYNQSDTDVYCRFTTGTTGGFRIDASGGSAILELGANQVVYLYSSGTGKIVNVSFKIK
jgi:hypothetical protein